MRPLSASSYSLLLRLSCPILVTPATDMNEQLRAATLWHFVHTADIDWLERATDAEIHHAAAVQGHTLKLEDYPKLFRTMTTEMERMKAAFVEAESPGDPFSTTPTSPTSESA
jgi:hypothetical protein